MTYDDMFTTTKGDDWVNVGELSFAGTIGGVSGRTVSFYATNPTAVGDLTQKPDAWERGLPKGAMFRFTAEASE